MNFYKVFKKKLPIIGMIHLPPLLGYKNSPGLTKVIEKALVDLELLEKGDVDGVMVENEHDRPHQVTAGPETIAAMSIVTKEVVDHAKKTIVGIEILLNDPKASLAVAKACNAAFIRTDYFIDKMTRPEYGGEMRIDPKGLISYRKKIKAENILILADIQVKYAKMLEKKSIAMSAKQAKKEKADAIIVTGKITGDAPIINDIKEAKQAVGSFPILVGSGLTAKNANKLLARADGAIVGTGIKTGRKVDLKKIKKLMETVEVLRNKKI